MTETTSWQILRTPGEAWEAMYEDCRRARRSIDFEQYLVEDDAIGRRFLELFREKARREGVRVRALCDMVGSLGLYRALWGDHVDPDGLAVRFYNPVGPWRINRVLSWSRRDHRKLLVVDDEVGHIGGVCVAERMRTWRDTQVRVVGPVVREMSLAFDQLWRAVEGGPPPPAEPPPADPADAFRLVTNAPHPHRNGLYRVLLGRVRGARAYVFLTTPYFIPGPAFFRALRHAARRGVEVGLLLPEENDVALVKRVSESYFPSALRAGVRIFLYRSTILHAKTAVIDDAWATVGSANLDYLSFFGNHEANLVATEPAFVMAVKRDFLADLDGAREVVLPEWRRSWHPAAGLLGRAGRLVRGLL